MSEIKIACLATNLCTICDWNMVSSTEVWWPFAPPPYFNSIIRCFTMCLETRIFSCGINWNHKLMKLYAMATILEGDVFEANYMGWLQGVHAAMCGPRHVVLYFLTLVRTITAEILWIRTTRRGKKYIFFIFWSRGWFRCHGNQIQTRRWHTEVCALPFPNIYINKLISLGDL